MRPSFRAELLCRTAFLVPVALFVPGPALAQCVQGEQGAFVCSGSSTTPIALTGASDVSVNGAFSVTTPIGPALSITAGGGPLTYQDRADTVLFADASGLGPLNGALAVNSGGGSAEITARGDYSGLGAGGGIRAVGGEISLALRGARVRGDVFVDAEGDASVLAEDAVLSNLFVGGTNVDVDLSTGTTIDGVGDAVRLNNGAGAASLAIGADVEAFNAGDAVVITSSGTSVDVEIGGSVRGASDGIRVEQFGRGPVSFVVTGDVEGSTVGIASAGTTDDPFAVSLTIAAGGRVAAGAVGFEDFDTAQSGKGAVGNEATVRVAGTLDGGALLRGGDDTFVLETGGTVTGLVDGGDDADTFVLEGTAAGGLDLTGFDFDNDGNYGVAALTVTGFESFVMRDAATVRLTGANAEAGTIDAEDGVLDVQGQFTGLALNAAPASTVAGVGRIGSLDLGGTLAPGNSIGTLSVAGDAVLRSGSVYEVEIGVAPQADLLDVGGAVTIETGALANVSLIDAVAAPNADDTFEIIRAGQGLSGAFDMVTDDVPDISFDPTYAANGVSLTAVAAPVPEAPVDGTLSEKTIGPAAGQSMAIGLQGAADTMSEILFERASAERALSFASTRGGAPEPVRFAMAGGFASRVEVDDDGAARGFDADARGGMIGLAGLGRTAALASGEFLWGVALFSQGSDVSTASARAETDARGVALLGGAQVGDWALRGELAFAALDMDLARGLAPGVVARGRTDGEAAILSLKGSYTAFQPQVLGLQLEPRLELDLIRVGFDSYTETGAGLLNLAVEGEDLSLGFLRAGMVARSNGLPTGPGTLDTEFDFGLEQAFGDVEASFTSVLAALPGAVFTETSAGPDHTRLTGGVSLTYRQDNMSAYVRYGGRLGERTASHRASVGIDITF